MVDSLEIRIFWFRVSTYTCTAAISLWSYDYLLTIADELELLWSKNGIFIKGLYLAGRYLPIPGMVLIGNNMLPTWELHRSTKPLRCRMTFTVNTVLAAIQNIVSMTIFTTRLCAIFVMRPRFRRFLILSLVLSNLALMIFVIFNLIHLLPGMGYAAHVKACITPDYHNWSVGASYVTPIFMESLIFFATLFHAFEYRKTHPRARSTWTGTMLHRLYVDGIQYYLLVLLFRLGTVLVFYTAPFALQLLFSYFEYLVSSTLTSRFFLSFRRTLVNVQTLSTQATNSSSTATGPGFSRAFSWSVKVGSKDSRTDTSGTVGTNEHHAMEELHIQ